MVRNSKMRACAVLLALGLALCIAQTAAAQPARQADPATVLASFEAAVGDPNAIEAELALFADSGVQKIIPAPQGTTGVWSGKAELRQAFEYAVAHKVSRKLVGAPQVDGNRVTGTAMVSNDAFQGLGVAPVKFTIEATVENGKITAYTTTIAPEERARVAAAASGQARPPAGMPQTGGANSAILAALAAVAMFLLLGGALIRLQHRQPRSASRQ